MNKRLNIKGVYSTDIDAKGKPLEYPEISVNDDQSHATLNADGTKTLKLVVREDRVPDNYGKIEDFRVDAHVVYSDIEAKWKADNLTVTFSDGKTVTIENGGTVDAE
jgi:hypothetical protein